MPTANDSNTPEPASFVRNASFCALVIQNGAIYFAIFFSALAFSIYLPAVTDVLQGKPLPELTTGFDYLVKSGVGALLFVAFIAVHSWFSISFLFRNEDEVDIKFRLQLISIVGFAFLTVYMSVLLFISVLPFVKIFSLGQEA